MDGDEHQLEDILYSTDAFNNSTVRIIILEYINQK